MNILKSGVSSSNFQLPFAKILTTYLSRDDYDNLTEAHALRDMTAFRLLPKDSPLIPEKYLVNEWHTPFVATRQLVWCGLADNSGNPRIPDHFWSATYRAQVLPKNSNDIYVFDGQVLAKERDALHRKCFIESRNQSNEEVSRLYYARANTLMAITDYRNNFNVPVVVIARKLEADELIPLP